MEKKIHDQLEESHAKNIYVLLHLRRHCLAQDYEGPFAVDKEYQTGDEGNYSPMFKTTPQTTSVSIWNFYPDPDAATMEEAEYIIERHKMSRSQMRGLKIVHTSVQMQWTTLYSLVKAIVKSGGNTLWKTTQKKIELHVLKF